jgi:prepilin-type N-terminal cleavage/methylation domain-containing protein
MERTMNATDATADRRHPQRGKRSRRRDGFTLIEVMVVVAIVGVIASTAIPTFMRYVYKARRAEAVMALQVLSELQNVHYGEKGGFSDSFAELGFDLEGAVLQDDGSLRAPYYTYTLEARALNGRDDGNYRGTATGDIDPSDPVLDIIIIENDLTVLD